MNIPRQQVLKFVLKKKIFQHTVESSKFMGANA